MAFTTWQIGLDIQNKHLCALALQPRRNGWQLRHWWHWPLSEAYQHQDSPCFTPSLLLQLAQWRRQLPQRYSLRIGIPPQLALQRSLNLPEMQLREPALGHYVQAASKRLFPLDTAELTLDYRPQGDGSVLAVTAAHRQRVNQWLQPLSEVGLAPTVIDLTTSALACVAQQASLPANSVLVHQQEGGWLWYRCATGECGYSNEGESLQQLQQRAFSEATSILLSNGTSAPDAPSTHAFSPFSVFRFLQPPLPEQPGLFTVAAGLALRSEETTWC